MFSRSTNFKKIFCSFSEKKFEKSKKAGLMRTCHQMTIAMATVLN